MSAPGGRLPNSTAAAVDATEYKPLALLSVYLFLLRALRWCYTRRASVVFLPPSLCVRLWTHAGWVHVIVRTYVYMCTKEFVLNSVSVCPCIPMYAVLELKQQKLCKYIPGTHVQQCIIRTVSQ